MRYRVLIRGQLNGYEHSAAIGVFDAQRAEVAADNLVAHGEANAAAAPARAALVEFLLDKRQLGLRNARAIVTYLYTNLIPPPQDGYIDLSPD